MSDHSISEHDVVLLADGEVGTVVAMYDNRLLVEITDDGRTVGLRTVRAADVERIPSAEQDA